MGTHEEINKVADTIKNIPSINFVQSKCQQLSMLIQETNLDVHTSVSIGIAFLNGENTYEDIFEKADDALYQAKRNGGAQVVIKRTLSDRQIYGS